MIQFLIEIYFTSMSCRNSTIHCIAIFIIAVVVEFHSNADLCGLVQQELSWIVKLVDPEDLVL